MKSIQDNTSYVEPPTKKSMQIEVTQARTYLGCIIQDNTICKILVYAFRQWWHFAHYAGYLSHATKIETGFMQHKSLTKTKRTGMYSILIKIKIL